MPLTAEDVAEALFEGYVDEPYGSGCYVGDLTDDGEAVVDGYFDPGKVAELLSAARLEVAPDRPRCGFGTVYGFVTSAVVLVALLGLLLGWRLL